MNDSNLYFYTMYFNISGNNLKTFYVTNKLITAETDFCEWLQLVKATELKKKKHNEIVK